MSLIKKLALMLATLYTGVLAEGQEQIVIGISQIIEHPALDEERRGLLAKLAEAGYVEGKQLKVIYQNAQGSLTTAAQIAQKLVSEKPKVIVAISTPSAQTVKAQAIKNHVPMIFTAVTDPVAAKILATVAVSEEFVTGVTDQLPLAPQLELIKQMVPGVKKVGVIYSSGEINSVTTVNQLKNLAPQVGFEIIEAAAEKSADVTAAVNKLIGQVEAIFIPNDNTAVAAIETIVKNAHAAKIPVFAGDSGSIDRGAVAGLVYNRFELGQKVGDMVLKVIDNQPITAIKVEHEHPLTVMINKKSAHELKIELSHEIQNKIKMVEKQ